MKSRLITALLAITALCATAQDLRQKSLDMLYMYMPASDAANYPRSFFVHNVDMSLRARKEMPWGKTVPEREFLHFVVPVRVNNEALDNHREVFYNELRERVGNMSMRDAILEINHWCHEKVSYQPSDGRTHSPLQSVSSAIGRCGEESTFGVAALRAMGIPARQVYTPRWAHTDDNHAWVEAWADGEWYFLGACEPEPVLNLGWFNSPASRGMLMHARAFGPYSGKEEILSTADGITDINVTDHYAPVDTLTVVALGADGKPAAGATVDFRIYNYGEFYPIASKKTDKEGRASLVTGLGDILVWLSDGKSYAFRKARTGTDRQIVVQLPQTGTDGSFDLDITPPAASASAVTVSKAMKAANEKRLSTEDSIRNAYIATFVIAGGDSVSELTAKARGNHAVISKFLSDNNYSAKAFALLRSLSEKDLTDVTAEVLADSYVADDDGSPLFARYVMSPRIASEALTAFRSYFTKAIADDDRADYRANPKKWVRRVAADIDASEVWFPISATMNPAEVHKRRKTSALSRDIYFVASARAMGIPARIDPVTGKTQWADADGVWHDAVFSAEASTEQPRKHRLTLTYTPSSTVADPLYYAHFTISRIENGRPHLLEFDDFMPWSKGFSEGVELDEGRYMIVSGQRLADGGVLSHMDILDLTSDTTVPLTLRSDDSKVQVVGSFDSESRFTPRGSSGEQSVLATTGRGYFVIGAVKGGNEPSNHVLRDISALRNELEKEGIPIVLLTSDSDEMSRIDSSILDSLPSTVTLGYDTGGNIIPALAAAAKSEELPLILIADTFNRVVFISSGYSIGMGTRLLDTIRRIK